MQQSQNYGKYIQSELKELLVRSAKGIISDSDCDKLLLILKKHKKDFASYCFEMMPDGFNSGGAQISWKDFHIALMDEAMWSLLKGRGRTLLEMPPQHGKSLIYGVLLPTYIFAHYPDKAILYCTYDDERAGEVARDVKEIILSDKYQSLFGHKGNIATNNTDLTKSKRKVTKDTTCIFNNVHGRGKFKAVSIYGSITGNPGDVIIVDDYFKGFSEASSKHKRDKLYRTYTTCIHSRLQANSVMFVFATRWHKDDLIGRIMAIDNNRENKIWNLFRLPDFKDDETTNHYDNRKLGEPLIPELEWKYREAQEEYIHHDYMALYRQIPPSEAGTLFKREWFIPYHHHIDPSEFARILISIDTNYNKHAKNGDDCAITVWGESQSHKYYLIEFIAERFDIGETKEQIYKLMTKYPNYNAILIENKANGQPIIDELSLSVSKIIPYEPSGTNKYQRATLVVSSFRAGDIYVPSNKLIPNIEVYVSQMIDFTGNNKEKDDLVDSSVMAIQYLAGMAPMVFTSESAIPTISSKNMYDGYFSSKARIIKQNGRVSNPFGGKK